MALVHNISLECIDGFTRQLDIIGITTKYMVIFEVKTLKGILDIKTNGDIMYCRETEQGRVCKYDGPNIIYQTKNHVKVMRELVYNLLNISSYPIYNIIVLANDSPIIDRNREELYTNFGMCKLSHLIEYINILDSVYTGKNVISEAEVSNIGNILVNISKPVLYTEGLKKYGFTQQEVYELCGFGFEGM